MPAFCIVVGCGSRGERDKVGFYGVPTVLNHRHMVHKNKLSKERRDLWIAAIQRDDLTDKILKNERVCGKHFITGKPANLEDKDHPDWVPSQFMGRPPVVFSKRKSKSSALCTERDHPENIGKQKQQVQVEEDFHDQPSTSDDNNDIMLEVDTGVAVQTELTMRELEMTLEKNDFPKPKIKKLQRLIEDIPYGLAESTCDEEKWKYYTGFSYYFVRNLLFRQVGSFIPETSTTALSAFNQLLLTLIKLRRNYEFEDLAYQFKVSASAASSCLEVVIHIMYKRFQTVIKWPDDNFASNIPTCFTDVFHDKSILIIDCLEVLIEKPFDLQVHQETWSNHKNHNMVKYLIAITPQGCICYISDSWGGRISDKQIVHLSGFFDLLEPGNIVLADRSFLRKDMLGVLNDILVIPAFTRGKNQLEPLGIGSTKNTANIRIQVEKMFGCLKNKFNFFKGTIPVTMIKTPDSSDHNALDKIVLVCCALMNLSEAITPL